MEWMVDLTEIENKIQNPTDKAMFRYRCRMYLRNNIGWTNELWENDWHKSIYYFAEAEDAIVFKLKFLN
jgi:hypothetical protein